MNHDTADAMRVAEACASTSRRRRAIDTRHRPTTSSVVRLTSPAQTMFGSDGAIAISPIESDPPSRSKTGFHVVPPLTVLKIPPDAAAMKMIFGFDATASASSNPPAGAAGPIWRHSRPSSGETGRSFGRERAGGDQGATASVGIRGGMASSSCGTEERFANRPCRRLPAISLVQRARLRSGGGGTGLVAGQAICHRRVRERLAVLRVERRRPLQRVHRRAGLAPDDVDRAERVPGGEVVGIELNGAALERLGARQVAPRCARPPRDCGSRGRRSDPLSRLRSARARPPRGCRAAAMTARA